MRTWPWKTPGTVWSKTTNSWAAGSTATRRGLVGLIWMDASSAAWPWVGAALMKVPLTLWWCFGEASYTRFETRTLV